MVAWLAVVAVFAAVTSVKADTFLYLVRQWPTTYCTVEARCSTEPDSDSFSIHGLWPNYDRGGYPENCTNEQYDPSKISNLRGELQQAWESYSEPNDEFWAHEWECHGTCTNFGQAQFFQTVLNLHRKYNIEDALQAANIVPDDRTMYNTADIADAIKEAYGAEPTVRCANRQQEGRKLLDSIFMCFNENLEAEDCQDACPSGACEKVNCKTALYPPVNADSADAENGDVDVALSRRKGRSECRRGDHGPSKAIPAAS